MVFCNAFLFQKFQLLEHRLLMLENPRRALITQSQAAKLMIKLFEQVTAFRFMCALYVIFIAAKTIRAVRQNR
jgi:hypothetical protein